MINKNLFKQKINTASLVLIPVAVGINYIGKAFAQSLKLPLWLGSIGTAISSMLAGPLIGAICGAINNLVYGLTDVMSMPYALTSVFIGASIGILARKNKLSSISKVILSGLLVAVIAAVVSTPLNIIFWGGTTGNVWGDTVFTAMMANHFPEWISSFVDEFIIDIPDKIVTMLIAYGIVKNLPERLTLLYQNTESIEEL